MRDDTPMRIVEDVDPPLHYPDYRSATWRVPTRPFVVLPGRVDDLANPLYGEEEVGELDNDLTRQHRGEPLGERIIVTGRLLEENGRPVRELAHRDLAAERGRTVPAQGRPASSAARSQLHGRGSHAHRRGRPL